MKVGYAIGLVPPGTCQRYAHASRDFAMCAPIRQTDILV